MPMKPDQLVETSQGLGVTFINYKFESRYQVWVRLLDTGYTVQFMQTSVRVVAWD